jgi:DNA-binding NtrC family response regulator
VYGIVEQHDGWINVYSELGKGTTFHIYIPMSEEKTAKSQMDVPYEKFRGGGERILFVEDEEMIRKVTVNILEKKGFQVFVAENVVQAYTLFQQENGRFDLVISDVVLPDGNGLSLIKKLLELNPELPVIMSSGYTDRKSQWESIKKMGMKFLQKPYSLVTLLKSIHEVIEK